MDTRTPPEKEDSQRNKAEVLRLRRTGMTFTAIGQERGFSRQRAHQIYKEALAEIPEMEVKLYRAEQQERLDDVLRAAYEVLQRKHLTISGGKIVRIGEPVIDPETGKATIAEEAGEPVYDDGPTLAAIKTILQVEERRAKLLGLDAPVKADLGGSLQVRYLVENVDLKDLT